MFYFVNMRTGESRWLDVDADWIALEGDKWERKGQRVSGGVKIEATTNSPAYEKWFHSEPVQAKLKSGEYTIMPKSADMNHR